MNSPMSPRGPMGPMTANNLSNCLQATKGPIIRKNSAVYQDVIGRSQKIRLMPGEAQVLRMKYGK